MRNQRNSFQPASFNMGSTYNERTRKFVGVDLTSPQMDVNIKRGVYSNNYVKKANGKVETRFSYENVFKDENVKIINVFSFLDRLVIAIRRYGNSFDHYELTTGSLDEEGLLTLDETPLYDSGNVSKGIPVSQDYAYGVMSDGKLWVLFNSKYFVIYRQNIDTVSCDEVIDWQGTHVPTVTYMGVATNAANVPSVTNVTLEYPNLLSKYRRDMFLTGLGIAENTGKYAKYKLKGNVSLNGIEVKLETNSEPLTAAYTAVLPADATLATNEQVSQEAADFINNYMKAGDLIFAFDDEFEAYTGQNGYYDTSSGFLFIEGTDIGLDGVIHLEADGSATLFLFSDPVPAVAGKPNLIVKYVFVDGEQAQANVDLVRLNTHGVMFGKNNSLNRLWLFGDPSRPNYAIHSAEPYKNLDDSPTRGDGDFSYFPDEGIIKFGEADNAIVGMIPLSPDRMMVLKNRSGRDRTMYFVSPYDVQETIARAGKYGTLTISSDVVINREEYSTSMSNTSTAGLSAKTVDVVNGETLFVSPEGQLLGLDVEGITGDSQRVANSRSYFIDKELMGQDMSNANLFHDGKYLYLSTDEKLYVASIDSLHYAATDSESEETSKQYEWWPCDPLPSKVVSASMLIDGKVVVSTIGGVYVFRDDPSERADIDREYIQIEAVSYSGSNFVTSAMLAEKLPPEADVGTVSDDDLWEFDYKQDFTEVTINSRKYCPSILLTPTNRSSAKIKVIGTAPNVRYAFNDAYLERQARRGERFIKYYPLSGLSPAKYVFAPTDEYDEATGKEIYTLVSEAGSEVGSSGIVDQYFYLVVPNTEVYAFAKASAQGEVNLYGRMDDGTLNRIYLLPAFGDYNDAYPAFVKGSFKHLRKTIPFFAALRLTQGKLGYDKTIENLTVWNDSNNPCELYVGVLRNKQGEMEYTHSRNVVLDNGIGFDFEGMDFVDTAFDKNAVPKFNNFKRLPRSQQSFTICFTAKSKRNSVLGGVDILYRVKKARNKR